LNLGNFVGPTLLYVLCGETCLFVSSCVGDRCGMVGNDEDPGRSRGLGAVDQGWTSTGQVLGGRMIETPSDAVCCLHHAQGDEERGFRGLASK
jgi:hypothetical protein